jgi:hypothetical protein
MRGNKNQHGKCFTGITVITPKHGMCTIVDEVSDIEYRRQVAELDKKLERYTPEYSAKLDTLYENVFTLQDSDGNIFKCGRGGFVIPRNSKS